MITSSEVTKYYQEHLQKEESIWAKLQEDLTNKYMAQGFYSAFAGIRAKHEVLALRSKARNPVTTRIPPEQTTQGDLD